MGHPLQRWMKDAGFRSKSQLAQRILERAPGLYPDTDAKERPRRVALELTRLTQGKVSWWKNQETALRALSDVLQVPAQRLLGGGTPGELIEFIEFPALHPLDPRTELPLEGTGWTSSSWDLFTGALSPDQWMWVQVPPGAGKSLATRIRQAREEGSDSKAIVRQLGRLAEIASLRLPGDKFLFLEVSAAEPQTDEGALRELEQYKSVVVVASFRRPELSEERKKRGAGKEEEEEPPKRWVDSQWTPRPGWRREFANWVARRLPERQQRFRPEEFSAWLGRMDPKAALVRTPGELLTLCDLASEVGTDRLAHQFAKGWRDVGRKVTDRMLQREASGESVRAFWLRAAGAEAVRSLISVALEDISSPWPPSATAANWAERLPSHYAAPASDEMLDKTLRAIGRARGSRERQHQIEQAKASLKPLSPLMAIDHLASTRLLRVQGDGLLGPHPRWMVDALARERIEDALSRTPESWGRWAADPGRQRLVDDVLDALSTPKLLALTEKAVQGFDASVLGCVGAVEALFSSWGRRLEHEPARSRAEEIACLHELVHLQLGLLPRGDSVAWQSPVSRSGFGEESNAWLADCWAWSFLVPAPPWPVGSELGWLFPGWTTPSLSASEIQILDALDPRDGHNYQRIMTRVDSLFELTGSESPPWRLPLSLLPAYTVWATRHGKELPQLLVDDLLRKSSYFLEELLQRFQQVELKVQVSLAGTLFRSMARMAQGVGQILNLVDSGDSFQVFSSGRIRPVPLALADWMFARLDEEHILQTLEEVGPGSPKIAYCNRLPARILLHLVRHHMAQRSDLSAMEMGRLAGRLVDFTPEHVPVIELFLKRGSMFLEAKGANALWRLAPERASQLVLEAMEESTNPIHGEMVGEELLNVMPPSWQARILDMIEAREPGARPGWVLQWLRHQVRAGGALAERAYALSRGSP